MTPAKHHRKAPVGELLFRGVLNRQRTVLTFYCPFCQGHHRHGWPPTAPTWAVAPRGSHCTHPKAPNHYWIGVSREMQTALAVKETR